MGRSSTFGFAGFVASTLVGCSGSGGDDPFESNSGATDTGSTATNQTSSTSSTTGTATGTRTGTAGSATDTDDIKFDIGTTEDLPGGACTDPDDPNCGCDAVDVLFIVDNSGSMTQHKDAVVAAFDPFVEEMISTLPPATSLHVGVTRATGFYDPGNGSGWGGAECEASFVDGTWYPPDQGNNNTNGQQGRLYEQDAMRYFELETGQNPAPLKTWFEATLAGAIASDMHSNTETVVAGAAYPFHPANATHNTGFMREQGVLVLFLLSDAPDMTPKAVPTQDFIDIVSDAKSACGDMCVLTTGAIAGGCYDGMGITNNRLFEFMNGFGAPPASFVEFEFNMTPDFTGVLSTTLSEVIATTCDNIPPQG